MQGSFSAESLEAVSEIFDFVRCQRPDGSTYGSRGRCKQGVPVAQELPEAAKPKRKRKPGVLSKEEKAKFDSLYQNKDDAASDRKHFVKKIRELDKKESDLKGKLKKAKAGLAALEKKKSSPQIEALEAKRQEAAERSRKASEAKAASEARLAALRARLEELEAKHGKLTRGRRRNP